jgi:hypothetical protein
MPDGEYSGREGSSKRLGLGNEASDCGKGFVSAESNNPRRGN